MSGKKTLIIVISVVVGLLLIAAGAFLLWKFLSPDAGSEGPKYVEEEYTYEEALSILEGGDQAAGIAALRTAKGEEAAAKRKEIYLSLLGEEKYNHILNAKVGDKIKFGAIEQDDNLENGSEEILWRVLDTDGEGRFLLVTEYAIECVRYHKKAVDITWEESDMRKWLNDGFIGEAFSEEESWLIPRVYVENKDNPVHGTDAGNDTVDRVFLLSIQEAEKYFKDDLDRKTSATETAKLHYAYCDPFNNTAWWLRSPSFKNNKAALVSDTGEILEGAYHKVTERYFATRPAIWIDLA